MVTLSAALRLSTRTVKVASPSGSATSVGSALLVTAMDDGTSVMVTVASAAAAVMLPSLSSAVAVTVSV